MNLTSATRTGATLGSYGDSPAFVPWANARFSPLHPAAALSMQALSEHPETELLAAVARGDLDSFSRLYDRFAAPMFSIAFRILQDNAAAEDVVQEAFVQIWEKAASYQPVLGRPLTWAITLVRNRAIDRLRSAHRSNRLIEAVTEEVEAHAENQHAADASLLHDEAARAVRNALASLGAEQRQAIELAFFAGLSQSEIAAALGVPLGTVKARIRRGLLQLRQTLEAML